MPMRQIVMPRAGKPESMEIRETAMPDAPGPREVCVEVRAIGINFADLMARKGLYPDAPPFPCVVGYEVAGFVYAVGAEVTKVKEGDRVAAMTRFGGYATHVRVPEDQVFTVAERLSHAEAASIPVVYATAWALMRVMGTLHPGETVLIQNAGGGVGLAAIDIARHVGATSIGTASGHKHPFLLERGLTHAIDYRTQDVVPEVMRLTGDRGVELILDPIGGADWKRNYRMLRSTGRLGMFGASTMSDSRFGMLGAALSLAPTIPIWTPIGLMNANKGVFGVNMGHMWHEVDKVGRWFDAISAGIDEGWIRPYVDRTFAFDEVSAAHAYIEGRGNTGKVVLTV